MHELSIALSIIEGVEEELVRRGGPSISVVHLRLGPLSGVVKEALLFSYELACEGTPLAGSTLEIEGVPVIVFCPDCKKEQPVKSMQCLCCAVCGAPSGDVRRGSELEVFALELMDERATAAG
ncbi:MAG: hydrogenase maturation nickel metallochaperone HypA [Bryobacteraceae bacterium]